MTFQVDSPKLTVDMIVRLTGKPDSIILVERKYEPFGWALPGGFVDIGETLEEAVAREILEETSLHAKNIKQFHAYSDPARDERFHTVSMVFTGDADGVPAAADDAKNVDVFYKNKLPDQIAFDHRQIIEDYFEKENHNV